MKRESFRRVGSPGSPSSTIGEGFRQPVEASEGVSDRAKSGFTHRSLAGEDEGASLLAQVKQREARMTNLLWRVPGSGFEDGYLPREEYFRRLEVCLSSRDPARRQAAVDEMKARLAH